MNNAILETERLWMRKFMVEDAEDMYLLNADPDVLRYTGDKAFESVEESYKFIEKYNPYDTEGFGRWVCVTKDTNEVIGWCGLRMQYDINMVDLGYRFHKRFWGKGYATESGLASIEHGFKDHNLDVIIGRAAHDNIASINVLKKCGMQYWQETTCGDDPGVYYRVYNPYKNSPL